MAGMSRTRRSPLQLLIGLGALLLGAWLCLAIAARMQGRNIISEGERLPDREFVGLSRDQVLAAVRDWPGMPGSASDISLRQYAVHQALPGGGIDNGFQQCMRLGLEASEVTAARFAVLGRPGRRRPIADLPPAWFPVLRDDQAAWRLPSWWQPQAGGYAVYHFAVDRQAGSATGEYLHYHPATGYLHVWEWRRADFVPPESPLEGGVVDLLAQELGRRLLADRHPPGPEGWLHAPELDPALAGIDPARVPEGLGRLQAQLRPAAASHRYILALHGVELPAAERLLADLPMRPLANGSAPPAQAWAHARPRAGMPDWFSAGSGQSWGYTLVDPAQGAVLAGRWASWQAEPPLLLVWDWAGPTQPPAADLFGASD